MTKDIPKKGNHKCYWDVWQSESRSDESDSDDSDTDEDIEKSCELMVTVVLLIR